MVGMFVRAGLQAIKGVKPFKKLGGKTVEQVKDAAAKAKRKAVNFNLDQTFKKTDQVLNKLKKTIEKNK